MDPMPPLQGAVHPPRVEPPTFFDRHPRLNALWPVVLWTSLLFFSSTSLSRSGFTWVSAITAGMSTISLVVVLARFPWRGATAEASATD